VACPRLFFIGGASSSEAGRRLRGWASSLAFLCSHKAAPPPISLPLPVQDKLLLLKASAEASGSAPLRQLPQEAWRSLPAL